MLSVALLAASPSAVAALPAVPALTGHINDRVGLLPAETRTRLEGQLSAFEQQTSHQLAVLIVDSLQGEDVESYALRVAEAWKLGHARHDNGLLLLIALSDRRMRIEVGYGLEGSIPDLLASRIIRNVLTPAFRARDYGGGVERALALLMDAARGLKVQVPERARSGGRGSSGHERDLVAAGPRLGPRQPGARRQASAPGGRAQTPAGSGRESMLWLGLGLGLGGPWGGPRGRDSDGGGLWGGGGGGGFGGGGGGFGGGGASGGW